MTRHHPAVLQCILAGLLIVALAAGLGVLFNGRHQPSQPVHGNEIAGTAAYPVDAGERSYVGGDRALCLASIVGDALRLYRSEGGSIPSRGSRLRGLAPDATTLRPRACIHPRARRSGDFRRAYA